MALQLRYFSPRTESDNLPPRLNTSAVHSSSSPDAARSSAVNVPLGSQEEEDRTEGMTMCEYLEFGGLNYPGHEVCMSMLGHQVLLYVQVS